MSAERALEINRRIAGDLALANLVHPSHHKELIMDRIDPEVWIAASRRRDLMVFERLAAAQKARRSKSLEILAARQSSGCEDSAAGPCSPSPEAFPPKAPDQE